MPARDMSRWTRTERGTWRYTPTQSVDENYEEMTKTELENELVARGLSKSGKKDELIARLQEADRT